MSDTSSIKIDMPTFVVDEQRYIKGVDSDVDGWAFVTFTPDGTEKGWADPFGWMDQDNPDSFSYTEKTDGWMRAPFAEEFRDNLINEGFTKVSWDTVPGDVFEYVQYNVAPIEWQDDAEVVKERTVIWIKGEWPILDRITEVAFGTFEV